MLSISYPISPDRIQNRLLWLAGLFLGLYSLVLTLSPAARMRSWEVELRWDHWLGYLAWCLLVVLVDRQSRRCLPSRNPYFVPLAAIMSGLGLLTIWRLLPAFGWRQTAWLGVGVAVLVLCLRLPDSLRTLRRYKYIWLTGGLALTALTLILGTNPGIDAGPRLWLGCCGVYFQPSEPLKLLLVIYLAAYFADRGPWLRSSGSIDGSPARRTLLPLLAPTVIMVGLTLLLLLVQRDLGTAMIFIFIYVVIAFLATGRVILLVVSGFFLVLAGGAGYLLFDVVQLRVDAWLNPWLDPSGGSYQIVQSLIAMANGGVGGRGPGLGNPSLVPIAHSDFIFAALIEEGGLVLAIALVVMLGLLAASGLRIALQAPDSFRRYLAAGLTAYLVGQSILIVGGNLRLLPLTGVTLPFVSYGGSSLLTAFLSLAILLIVSQSANTTPGVPPNPRHYLYLGVLIFGSLVLAALASGWWTVYRGPDLLIRTDNARRSISDRYVMRGAILDRRSTPLAVTEGSPGEFIRRYLYPQLGPLIGYNHPVYGQAGLEASLDPYLRGLRGNPALNVWWHHLLYGQPPPGVDVRLSLDLDLQQKADELLGDHLGALVLINAQNGEILAMASHPTYDPDQLSEVWDDLVADPDTPLIDRATQGRYPVGTALGPFLLAASTAQGKPPQVPGIEVDGDDVQVLDCAVQPEENDWGGLIKAGCAGAVADLVAFLGEEVTSTLIGDFGFLQIPNLEPGLSEALTSAESEVPSEASISQTDLLVSPLQMAIAAAVLSANGTIPAPRLATAVNLPDSGWSVLPATRQPSQVLSPQASFVTSESLRAAGLPAWESIARVPTERREFLAWFIAGTLPDWNGAPLALAVLLEDGDPVQAQAIGSAMLREALQIE